MNASYSEMHYEITMVLLKHGFHVLVEKPFARNQFECENLIKTAKENKVLLAVFQQTFFAPFFKETVQLMQSGILGEIQQISLRYNGFSRRWDWQTMQRKLAGSVYNTGPHPLGMALGLLGWDDHTKVVYSRLASTPLTSGDGDDYAKILLTAPDKPLVDVEISSTDAYCGYTIKIQGTKGTFKCTPKAYEYKYMVDGENPERPLIQESLKNEEGAPIYCSEKLILHEESGKYDGDAFNVGTAELYEDVYYAITEGRSLTITPEMVTKIVCVMEVVHAENPVPVKF